MKIKLLLFTAIILNFPAALWAQNAVKSVLFLGNSYVYTNDLPSVIALIADNMGDSLIYDSNCPGGYTFEGHSTNATSLQKIGLGIWDFVVLQEQSQIPSFPISQVESQCFPYATALNNLIVEANPCTETLFYMTWGRENGDSQNCANWPPVCTYEGMDDLLQERYMTMAVDNQGMVSPVAAVWRYIRENSDNSDLYSGDGSHPSMEGTYAAAVCFYTSIFKRNPELISYNGGLDSDKAAFIRSAVKTVVYDDQDNWLLNAYLPHAEVVLTETQDGLYTVQNLSENADELIFTINDTMPSWSGDSPWVWQPMNGIYDWEVIASKCGISDTSTFTVDVTWNEVNEYSDESELQIAQTASGVQLNWKTGQPEFVEVCDLRGRNIPFQFAGRVVYFDNRSIAPGVYIVQWGNSGNRKSARFLITSN